MAAPRQSVQAFLTLGFCLALGPANPACAQQPPAAPTAGPTAGAATSTRTIDGRYLPPQPARPVA